MLIFFNSMSADGLIHSLLNGLRTFIVAFSLANDIQLLKKGGEVP